MSDTSEKEVWAQASDRLRSLDSASRLRSDKPCVLDGADAAPEAGSEPKRLVNFSSNDYLGLSRHPAVINAATEATKQYGAGSTASRLVCGTLPIHHELEQALSEFKGTEASLVFSSGYLACLGVVQALATRSDDSRVPIIFDRLAHASLIDGATQNRRDWRSFPHNDLQSLEIILKKYAVTGWPSAVVITEGIFSMDGDVAPVAAMSEICARYKAILLIDDAHGTGVLGERGEGVAGMAGISGQPHVVQVGTLSKALGSQGGFVTGPAILRDLLVNTARTFIFDTGLNPGSTAAALAALQVMKDEPERRQKLEKNALLIRSLLRNRGCDCDMASPIVPVILKGEEQALAAAESIRADGFLVAAIRPPTVPPGTSRLRVALSAEHEEDDIRRLAQTIGQIETL